MGLQNEGASERGLFCFKRFKRLGRYGMFSRLGMFVAKPTKRSKLTQQEVSEVG
jgi:hypothetical protein